MDLNISTTKSTINCAGQIIDFKVPKIMGILNVTPDSFYDGGKFSNTEKVKEQVTKMIDEGADIIDIGAYSSRPGAAHISSSEEINRLKPVLGLMLKYFPKTIISVDTFRSEIASIAVQDYGVAIINDISAGEMDHKMPGTIALLQVPYIMMHMQGTPTNMQDKPVYDNLIEDIIMYFSKKLKLFKDIGIHDLIVDPGFGFGKTIEHNYTLLDNLDNFKILDLPILVGLSRKSMIYKLLGNSSADALNGTSVLNTIALLKGANILRVHDVLEAKQTILLTQKLNQSK